MNELNKRTSINFANHSIQAAAAATAAAVDTFKNTSQYTAAITITIASPNNTIQSSPENNEMNKYHPPPSSPAARFAFSILKKTKIKTTQVGIFHFYALVIP